MNIPTAEKSMEAIRCEVSAIDFEIDRLRWRKEGLQRALDILGGRSIFDLDQFVPKGKIEGATQGLRENPPTISLDVSGMDIYDAACAYLRALPKKTARMRDISEFLVEKGISKSKGGAAMTIANRMRRADNKIKRIELGTYKLYE